MTNTKSPWKPLDPMELPDGTFLGEFKDPNKDKVEYHVIVVFTSDGSTHRFVGNHFQFDMKWLKPLRYMEIPE